MRLIDADRLNNCWKSDNKVDLMLLKAIVNAQPTIDEDEYLKYLQEQLDRADIALNYMRGFAQYKDNAGEYWLTPILKEATETNKKAQAGYTAGYIDGYDARDAEIVRCKDCKYCYSEGFVNVRNVCEKHYDFGNVDDDWFCKDGERREEP